MQLAFSVEEAAGHPNLLPSAQLPFQIQARGDWIQVLNAFNNNTACRDFVYMGHGDPHALGQGAASVTIFDLQTVLQNNQGNPLTATNMHPFRFVFLDGCDTAEGNFPQTFGIPKQKGMQSGKDFVNKRAIRPRAFMGWDRSKFTHNGIIADAQLYPPHYDYISQFWSSWPSTDPQTGQPATLTKAINDAANKAPLAKLGMQLYGAEDLAIQF
jgi:hypothetical protein